MKLRLTKLIAPGIAILLIGFILCIINTFTGNPISASVASDKIKAYVKTTYPNMDLVISKASYNFMDSDYYTYVTSKTSKDTSFIVSCTHGKINDDYKYEVSNHMTTYRRLSSEFSKLIDKLITKDFPYETSIVLGDLGKSEAELNKLSLDMPLDLSNMPLDTSLSVYTRSSTLTYEELVKRLQKLQTIMNANNIPINFYSLVLENTTDKSEKPTQSLYLYDFPADKLNSDNLLETIKLHQQIWEKEHQK